MANSKWRGWDTLQSDAGRRAARGALFAGATHWVLRSMVVGQCAWGGRAVLSNAGWAGGQATCE